MVRNLKSFWLPSILLLSLPALFFSLLSKLALDSIFDDAYMFVRYADSIIHYGRIAWNHPGETVYGPSSLLYLFVLTPIRLLFPDNPSLTVVFTSLICGICFLLLIGLLVRRVLVESSPSIKGAVLVFLIAALFVRQADFYLLQHFLTGMDTTFVLVYLTGYIMLLRKFEQKPSQRLAVVTGIWGGVAFFARPDLLLFSIVVPMMMGILSFRLRRGKEILLLLLVSLVVVLLQMLWAHLYLHSALPLSFFIKGVKRYGEKIYRIYHQAPYQFLSEFLKTYILLVVAIVLDILSGPIAYWKRTSALEKGLLLSTVLFGIYYLFFVLQIMGFLQRFYYPVLPALIYLAVLSLVRLIEKVDRFTTRGGLFPELKKRGRQFTLAGVAIFVLVIVPATVSRFDDWGEKRCGVADFARIYDRCNDFGGKIWLALNKLAAIPDDLVVATTEIGCPGIVLERKVVVDMAGLNETHIAQEGFSPEYLFQRYRPDWIYMPHPDYTRMISQLSSDPFFSKEYVTYSAKQLNIALGVALLKKSRYYPRLKELLEKRVVESRNKVFTFRLPRYCCTYADWQKMARQ